MKRCSFALAPSSRIKVKRAKKHIIELNEAVNSFVGKHPYEGVPEEDAKTGDLIYRLHWLAEPPVLDWGGIVGDIVHNLRSALNVTWHQLHLVATGKAPSGDWPMYPSIQNYKTARLGESQIVPRATTLGLGPVGQPQQA